MVATVMVAMAAVVEIDFCRSNHKGCPYKSLIKQFVLLDQMLIVDYEHEV